MATFNARICIRRGLASEFTSANPTLALGEIAYETDTRNIKVGDGSALWNDLPYINPYRGGTAAADTSNVALGNQAGNALASGGINNVMVGELAGRSVTTGDDNVAIGRRAMINSSSTASANVMIGSFTGANVTGDRNVGIGSEYSTSGAATLNLLTSGAQNVAVGARTSVNLTTGSNTTAVGYEALRLNTASDITAVGANALDANTTGTNNTAVGKDALGANSTGSSNLAVGNGSLAGNTTGSLNTAVGSLALTSNSTGTDNVAIGQESLLLNNGNSNVAVGRASFLNLSASNQNVAIGQTAGRFRGSGTDTLTSATSSVFIGHASRAAGDSQTNQVVIAGTNGLGNGSNTTTIGNSSTTGTFIPAGDLILSGSTQQIVVGTSTIPSSETVFLGSRQFETNAKIQATGSGAGSNAAITLDANTEGNWIIQTGNAVAAGLRFYDFNAGGGSERIRFDASGNIDLKAGNVIVTSGKGIDFSATASGTGTMTSELLSDYEEGTWTPTFSPASGAFTTLTMDVQSATYTKIGRQVTVRGYIRTDNVTVGTASGQLSISGLPFTVAGSGFSAGSVSYAVNWAAAPESVYTNAASTSLFMTNLVSLGGGTTFTQVTALTTGATADRNELVFSCTYFV